MEKAADLCKDYHDEYFGLVQCPQGIYPKATSL